MKSRQRRTRVLHLAFKGTATLLLGVALFATPAAAGKSDNEKVMRQIGVMEKIIDKVLLDSPFLLVHSGDNTRGLFVDEFGAIFSFDASLTGRDFDLSKYFEAMPERFQIKTDEDGNQVIVIKKHEEELKKQADPESKKKGKKASEDDAFSDQATRYQGAKDELIQALLDYGETMSTLRNGQYIMIAAFMKQDEFMKANKISRLMIKAKMDDLRAFAQGDLTEDALRSRIAVDEY